MKKICLALSVFVMFIFIGGIIAHAKTTSSEVTEVINYVYVDVKGEVENPGVYRVSDKCRVFQVLEIAGGLTNESDTSNVNLASKIVDEQVIRIPKLSSSGVTQLININTATASELDSLPGIGYSTATNIIDYRNANGLFKAKEEIKLVNGIGDVIYDEIKDLITIW